MGARVTGTAQRRSEIGANLERVEARIGAACSASGRRREDLTLVAVTKTFPASDVGVLADLGVRDVGENRDQEASRKVIHKALDVGITLIDTADIYGNRGESETIIGASLGDRRKDIVLATKCGFPMDEAGTLKGASRRYILSAVEASLKRLKTDPWEGFFTTRQSITAKAKKALGLA